MALFALLTALAALTGCTVSPTPVDINAPAPTPATSPASEPPTGRLPGSTDEAAGAERWIVTDVVDGDTLDVEGGVASESVRILGIDTPERGECGFAAAAAQLSGLIGDVETVTLSAAGSDKDDQDHYGRILRYVDAGGVDVGLALIQEGYAIARYDSRDGYGAHPRERAYVEADEATPTTGCPTARTSESPPSLPPETNTPGDPGNTMNCGDFATWAAAQNWFEDYYPHFGDVARLDQDNDLIACEGLPGVP